MTRLRVLLTLWLATAPFQLASAGDYAISDLEAIAARNAGILSAVDLSFRETQQRVAADPNRNDAPIIVERIERLLCETSSKRYYCERQVRTEDMEKIAPPEWFAYAGGDTTQVYMPQGKAASLQRTTEPWIKMKGNPILAEGALLPPSADGVGLDDASILNLLRHASIVGQETLFDSNCVVLDVRLDGSLAATFWVDPQHGVLPRKWVMYGRNQEIVAESVTPEVAEFHAPRGDSIWLPARIEQVNTAGGMTVRRVTVLDTNRTVVNPVLDASDFEIDFPPGTKVQDMTGEQPRFYTVSDAGELVPDEYLEGLYTEHLRAKTQAGLDTNAGLGCGAGLLPPTLLLVTGFLSLLLVRQRRMNTTS